MPIRLQAVSDPATDQNFRNLEALFPVRSPNLAGVLLGASGAKLTVDVGSVTFEWAGAALYSKEQTTNHALGVVPKAVSLQPSGFACIGTVTELTKTAFKAKAYETNPATPPAAGTKVTFYWIAIG